MKRMKFLLVVCLLGMASTMSAQFVSTSSSSSSMNSNSDAAVWSGLRISYHPVSINADGGGDISLNGASVGYVRSFGVSASAPLFIETGASASWIGGEIEDSDLKLNVFSINVPVNFGYKFSFGDNNGIYPYAGLTLRGNIVGKYKADGESVSAFDDDLGDGWKLKRFQIGWQIGVGANFNTFYVGASYGTDFSDIIEDCKVAMPSISIGFNM
ncbi:MAG: outer membrane beta-barrel protein [Bacteroides sp.]|nr:outer membrane beta-barrel protein [Bacteroides sp.]